MLHKGLYTAFPICVLVSESRMWLPSAARWIKVNLEHIALIFKLYFFFGFLLQVSTSVKQQYHDNIRWIREAGRHSLVSAQPPAAHVAAPWPEFSSSVLGWKAEMNSNGNVVCRYWGWQLKPFSSQQDFRLSRSSSFLSPPHLEMLK